MGKVNEIYRGPLILLVLLLACILMLGLSNQTALFSDGIISARYIPWSKENKCLALYKGDFNDPDSAYVESSFIVDKSNADTTSDTALIGMLDTWERALIVNVRAKNTFGSYVKAYITCPMHGRGVDELGVATYRVKRNLQ